jgi:hypothetical protein
MWGGKTVMFVGDSLALNQYESLLCLLHAAAPGARTTVSPASGKIDPSYTVRFEVRSTQHNAHRARAIGFPLPVPRAFFFKLFAHGPRRAGQSLLVGSWSGEKLAVGLVGALRPGHHEVIDHRDVTPREGMVAGGLNKQAAAA